VLGLSDVTWGIAGGLGTGMVWAATSTLVRSLSGTLSPIQITAIRSAAGGCLLLCFTILIGEGSALLQAPLWAVLLLWLSILIAMGLGDTSFFASMDYLGVTRALTLGMANPLLTTLAGILLLGEPMTVPRVSGMLLVVGGIGLIVSGKDDASPGLRGPSRRGLRLVFFAATAWALSAIMIKAPLEVMPAAAATTLRFPAVAVVLWCSPWTRGTLRTVAGMTRADKIALGSICLLSGFGSLLFVIGIKYGGVAIGNVLSSTSPLFTLPYELWVLKQPISRQSVLGALVTVLGIGLMHF
jgi:drug/metabolite transporter (DMT)-like permease